MSWYKKSYVLNRFSKIIRDMEITNEQNFEENVKDLHELEFKYHKISTTPTFIHPKRQENILKLIHDKAWDYFKNIQKQLEGALNAWKNEHRIDNPSIWATNVFELWQESYRNEQETVENILKDGLTWGDNIITKKDIIKYVDVNKIREIIREDMDNDLEPFEWQVKEWLDIKYPQWEKEINNPLSYINEKQLEEDFKDYWEKRADISSFVSDYEAYYLIDRITIEKAIRKKLYPIYMSKWGSTVKEITKNVNIALKKLRSVNYKNNVSQMTSAISIALNVMHYGGNIAADKLGYDQEFLDEMSNIDTSEWVEEISKEFGV